jgi:hypothetical protein
MILVSPKHESMSALSPMRELTRQFPKAFRTIGNHLLLKKADRKNQMEFAHEFLPLLVEHRVVVNLDDSVRTI